MISDQDKSRITEIAKKYQASKILLFGSSLEQNIENSDIDLGVEGIPDSKFFEFYGELIFNLSKPVDVVDLKQDTRFNQLITNHGIVLYG